MWDGVRRVSWKGRGVEMENEQGVTKVGTLRPGPQCRSIARAGEITVLVSGRLAARLRALAIASGATSVENWCEQALEAFVLERRSGTARLDPARYADRHAEDWQMVG